MGSPSIRTTGYVASCALAVASVFTVQAIVSYGSGMPRIEVALGTDAAEGDGVEAGVEGVGAGEQDVGHREANDVVGQGGFAVFDHRGLEGDSHLFLPDQVDCAPIWPSALVFWLGIGCWAGAPVHDS